jgi:hypothetical protein
VDVDVDEPAVTVRWSILACGQSFVLPGSEGTHGSSLCGIPNVPLNIYVDGYVKYIIDLHLSKLEYMSMYIGPKSPLPRTILTRSPARPAN